MQVSVVSLGRRVDVDVEVSVAATSGVSVADIIEAATGITPTADVKVDGRKRSSSTLLVDCDLLRGSTIDATPATRIEAPIPGTISVRQTGGIDAGWVSVLNTGTHQLGKIGRKNGVPFASDHAVAMINVDSDGGVIVAPALDGAYLDDVELIEATEWLDQTLLVAGRLFRIDRTPLVRLVETPNRMGYVPVVRPARVRPRLDPEPISVPPVAVTKTTPRKLPIVPLLAPLPVAAVMSLVLGPRALLFGLLTPVMTLASWLEDKRQQRLNRKTDAEAMAAAVMSLRRAIQLWLVTEAARRREAHPNLADVVARAMYRSPRLWERRLDHDDALTVTLGAADQPGNFRFVSSDASSLDLDAIVASSSELPLAPVTVSLQDESGVGLAGEHSASIAVAWGLIAQLAVLHGPADIQVAVFTSEDHSGDWEALKWLPHALDSSGHARLCVSPDDAQSLAKTILDTVESDSASIGIPFGKRSSRTENPIWIVVTDDPQHYRGRNAPLRKLLADRAPSVKVIVLAELTNDLPAVCTAVLELRRIASRSSSATGTGPVVATLTIPASRLVQAQVIVDGLGTLSIDSFSRALASAEDPEHVVGGSSGLPLHVSLPSLLGFNSWVTSSDSAEREKASQRACEFVTRALIERWQTFQVVPAASPIGVSLDGVVHVDLCADGPHGLIAGTTGSGKSELLRTLVAGLASVVPPDQLHFLLVDYKGGSAFDACSLLPHVVGMVTDLDEHLGARVLQSLQAEIRYRERVLRSLGATDLDEVLAQAERAGERSPLARLVIVVDEFATLAAELPDFLPSLVDVAQRGRSLGMHLILATQRPAGVLDNKIRANTNLRIALRVQDDSDSIDVIGSKSAALIERGRAGRGIIRKAAGELTEFHAARVTKTFDDGHRDVRVEVRPFRAQVGVLSNETPIRESEVDGGESDLTILVQAIGNASRGLGFETARRPFLDALPEQLDMNDSRLKATFFPTFETSGPEGGSGYVVGLVDEPDDQRQSPYRVGLGPGMNLVAFGITGSGTTTFLRTLVLSAAACESPNDLHVYAIDADSGGLRDLEGLPHTGGVASLGDLAQVSRLLRVLAQELENRRASHRASSLPTAKVLLVIDNLGALRQSLQDDPLHDGVLGLLDALARDGSSLGINVVATANAERGVGSALLTAMPQRLVFRLVDTSAYLSFGVRPRDVPHLSPGRCLVIRPEGALELQIGCSSEADVAGVRYTWRNESMLNSAPAVPTISTQISVQALADAPVDAASAARPFAVPLGIDLVSGCRRSIAIAPGEHTLILGPARSGKSTLARMIVESLAEMDAPPRIAVLSLRPNPLHGIDPTVAWLTKDLTDLETWARVITENGGRRVVVIDDADRMNDPVLEKLALSVDDDLSMIVIARTEAMRGFGFWARPLAASRNGLILRPKPGDGECLRSVFPTRLPALQVNDAALIDDGAVFLIRTVQDGETR
jgi:DNA segregation ATPase FtsK/SpoIIIE, S-DNA-T family